MTASAPSRAILTPASADELGIRFVLSNPTQQPISLTTYEPFLQFRVRATADGAELRVEQPALDIPVRPKPITVPAAGSVELATPMRLRLRAGTPPSQDQFVWSIAHEPKGVMLTFTLDLPPPFDQPFEARI